MTTPHHYHRPLAIEEQKTEPSPGSQGGTGGKFPRVYCSLVTSVAAGRNRSLGAVDQPFLLLRAHPTGALCWPSETSTSARMGAGPWLQAWAPCERPGGSPWGQRASRCLRTEPRGHGRVLWCYSRSQAGKSEAGVLIPLTILCGLAQADFSILGLSV